MNMQVTIFHMTLYSILNIFVNTKHILQGRTLAARQNGLQEPYRLVVRNGKDDHFISNFNLTCETKGGDLVAYIYIYIYIPNNKVRCYMEPAAWMLSRCFLGCILNH